MQRFIRTLLLWTLLLGACSRSLLPTSTSAPPTLTPTSPPASAYEECAYQWAYKDLPELSKDFQRAIQELQPDAQANAYAFGEDCIRADGSRIFHAMETDFNITLQIVDINNEEELGEWIVRVMQIILAIPQDKIVGPRPGRVSILFQAGEEHQAVNFYIDQYQALSPDLSSAEMYRALKTPQ